MNYGIEYTRRENDGNQWINTVAKVGLVYIACLLVLGTVWLWWWEWK